MSDVTRGDSPGADARVAPAPHSLAQPTRHFRALDSLRGVAASAVVLHHCGLLCADYFHYPIAQRAFLWECVDRIGHSAVIIFFVLSGFVLQLSFQSTSNFNYFVYLIKRGCRIYPAMIVAIAASALLLFAIRPVTHPDFGEWLNIFSTVHPTAETIVRSIALIVQQGRDIALDPPLWSLAYEMRFSVLFPLMAVACLRWPGWFTAAMLLLYALTLAILARGGGGWSAANILGFGRMRMDALCGAPQGISS